MSYLAAFLLSDDLLKPQDINVCSFVTTIPQDLGEGGSLCQPATAGIDIVAVPNETIENEEIYA